MSTLKYIGHIQQPLKGTSKKRGNKKTNPSLNENPNNQ